MPQDPKKELTDTLLRTPPVVDKVIRAVRPITAAVQRKMTEAQDMARKAIDKITGREEKARTSRPAQTRSTGRK